MYIYFRNTTKGCHLSTIILVHSRFSQDIDFYGKLWKRVKISMNLKDSY